MNIVFIQHGKNPLSNLAFKVVIDNKPGLLLAQLLSFGGIKQKDCLQCTPIWSPQWTNGLENRLCSNLMETCKVGDSLPFVNQLWWEEFSHQ